MFLSVSKNQFKKQHQKKKNPQVRIFFKKKKNSKGIFDPVPSLSLLRDSREKELFQERKLREFA